MSPYRVRRDAVGRVDASMDLLNSLYRDSVEPDYALVTARDGWRKPRWGVVAVATLCLGVLAGSAATGTVRNAPAVAKEREDLIARVQQAATRQDTLRDTVNQLTAENRELSDRNLQNDPVSQRLAEQIEALETSSGSSPVIGPGVVLVLDDSDTSAASGSRVVDVDLRQAVNGLWQSGAEAVSVNGHRLSARTAIRGAGSAITVDYRSLTRPYRIEAIGNTGDLLARFPSSAGGAWWAYLRQNFDIRYELTGATSLRLSADPGLGLRFAARAK